MGKYDLGLGHSIIERKKNMENFSDNTNRNILIVLIIIIILIYLLKKHKH